MGDRHAFRAKWHEYNDGIYFITICTHKKECTFGNIKEGSMGLSELGQIVDECINDIESHNPNFELHNYVIMPNHIHMIVGTRHTACAPTTTVGTRYIASANDVDTSSTPIAPTNIGCLRAPRHGDQCDDFHHNSALAVLVGTFKAAVTRLWRKRCDAIWTWTRCIASLPVSSSTPVWQSRYHEHIIRDQRAYDNITQYINSNIINWDKDCFR